MPVANLEGNIDPSVFVIPQALVCAQLLAVAAVAYGGLRSIQRYDAVRTLTPPLPRPLAPPVAVTKRDSTVRPSWFDRQSESVKIGLFGLGLSALLVVIWGSLACVLWYGSQVLIDRVFGVFVWAMLSCVFFGATPDLTPCPTAVVYKSVPVGVVLVLEKTIAVREITRGLFRLPVTKDKVSTIASLSVTPLLAAGVIVTAAMGSSLLLPLIPSLSVLGVLASGTFPKVTTRLLAGLTVLSVVLPCLLFVIIGAFCFILDSTGESGADTKPDESRSGSIPIWIVSVGLYTTYLFVLLIPARLIGLAMRYDYFRDAPEPKRLAPGAPCTVMGPLRGMASFKPIMTAPGLLVFALSFLACDLLLLPLLPPPLAIVAGGFFCYLFTAPFTLAALSVTAWVRGDHRWWTYSETWVPDMNKDVDVELAMDGDGIERMPLLLEGDMGSTDLDNKADAIKPSV